jgi:heat-inducible transcriptional repressor
MTVDLTERQANILALIVREHIASAEPVASSPLVSRYGLAVSPATVRSEMAALTEAGLLRQPHTSAGRVPTVEGYRYFVEHLMSRSRLPEVERERIGAEFTAAGRDPERWLRLSAATIARCSGAAGLVAMPRRGEAPLRRLEMLDLGENIVQVVAILADGTVRQWRWRPDYDVDQQALDRLNELVNDAARRGVPLPVAPPADGSPVEAAGLEILSELLPNLSRPMEPRLYHAGLAHVLHEPEFADSERLEGVLELFEHGRGLDRLLEGLPPGRVEVLMGGDPPLEAVPHVTFVISGFGGDAPYGLLGVIGPRRLSYERVVPAVGFVARLVTRLYAGEEL